MSISRNALVAALTALIVAGGAGGLTQVALQTRDSSRANNTILQRVAENSEQNRAILERLDIIQNDAARLDMQQRMIANQQEILRLLRPDCGRKR